jgi:hypothetical protein
MGEMHSSASGNQGSPSGPSQKIPANMYDSVSGGIPNLEEELSIDKSTLETLKALYSAKERAV